MMWWSIWDDTRKQQLGKVVRVVPGADTIDVPSPSLHYWIELKEPFVCQSRRELDSEERIASGLLVYKFR
jgi:hypothetical protein